MFTRKERIIFVSAAFLVFSGFALMASDPAANGFGILTLWIAPPMLVSGFIIPVIGIIGIDSARWTTLVEWKRPQARYVTALAIFLVAFIMYLNTLEPTASLWDCSEFIASAYKLQVPHTPGTPLSLLIGRLFSMLSFGDVTRVAWTMNLMSAFFSAITVALVYFVILHMGERIIIRHVKPWALIIGASGGSLCLAFSDTFWFSAVEAETYGPACFFLVLLLWLILTGRYLRGPARLRRLILIFYVGGLAYCIHPMCLLALAVLPFAWLTDGKTLTFWHAFVCICGGLLIILLINRFVAVGIFEVAFSFDRLFVNGFHLPFYSGAIFFFLLLIAGLRTMINRFQKVSVYAWSVVFLLSGFTPYLLLFVRSQHDPPIDESNPENLPLVKAYMNREGYPTSPLIYGPYFDATIRDVKAERRVYFQGTDTYDVAGTLPKYVYDSRQTFLPRMYSNDPDHIEAYRNWAGLKADGRPSFIDNVRFLVTYQLGHMYFRYLMWNFAGRESEIQNSDWLRPWEKSGALSYEKARNQYWMIPFIIGVLGMIWQARHDRKTFISTTIFFLITGVILVLYLNSPPVEPRERDYIYVGSYIAFTMWLGLGLMSLAQYASARRPTIVLAAFISTAVPFWICYQNYDDHDRSGRTFQVDNARNILNSCSPNAILFTGGDNDTFPLWYVQEVEGYRTDVRVMVLSYMNTDWYINQLRKRYYDSPAFRLTLTENDYRQYGPNDVLYIERLIDREIDGRQFLRLLRDKHPALTRVTRHGEPYHILPSRSVVLDATADGTSPADKPSGGRKQMILTMKENYVSKNLLAIMDLIVSNGWTRPIYFNFTSANSVGADLSPYLIQEGPLYRLSADYHDGENIAVNTALTYRHLIEMADYTNLSDPNVHFNYEDYHARIIVPLRQSFNSLAIAFLDAGDTGMAREVLTRAMDKLYHRHLRPSYTNLQAAEILLSINEKEMADVLAKHAFDYYFPSVKSSLENGDQPDALDAYLLKQTAMLLEKSGHVQYLEDVRRLAIPL